MDFINWTLLPQLGQYPHGAITGSGEILVPPTEPGDKPVILRHDDRPKKQSTRLLKAECPECGYTIRLTKRWAALGLPSCPIEGARWRSRVAAKVSRAQAFTLCRRRVACSQARS